MTPRILTDNYHVSPQISPEDAAAIRDAGYVMVLDNRPDAEVPPEFQTDAMREAMEAAGLRFEAHGCRDALHGASQRCEALLQALLLVSLSALLGENRIERLARRGRARVHPPPERGREGIVRTGGACGAALLRPLGRRSPL